MKKKLAIILPVIAVVSLVMVFGAVGANAWFTDQDKSANNVITAGKVNPEIRGASFTLGNAAPDVWYGPSDTITFFNHTVNSTLPVKYKISSEFVSQSVGGLYDKVNIKVERREGDNWVGYYNGPLNALLIGPGQCGAMANVPSGESHDWRIWLQVDKSAGNGFQGATATFNLLFDSTQANNPGWGE